MSAKGCSPDNAAMEDFFGLFKKEFWHGRDWSEWTPARFIEELGGAGSADTIRRGAAMRSVAARRPSSAPHWEGPRNGPRNRPQSRGSKGKHDPFRDAASAPNKRPRLAMEPGPKAQCMQLVLSADGPSAMGVRVLPYPR